MGRHGRNSFQHEAGEVAAHEDEDLLAFKMVHPNSKHTQLNSDDNNQNGGLLIDSRVT